jgi:aspartyl protease family protein
MIAAMGKLLSFAVTLMVAGVLVARWADRTKSVPSTSAMAAAPLSSSPSNSRTITVPRSDDGHFRVGARIDGRRMELVVDTGASQIALRESDAARLGIHPTERDYRIKVATANGFTRAALVQLQMVESVTSSCAISPYHACADSTAFSCEDWHSFGTETVKCGTGIIPRQPVSDNPGNASHIR